MWKCWLLKGVVSNLPPSVDNASAEMQPELLKMQHLSIEELLAIANANVEPSQHERHLEQLDKNKEGSLTSEERQELTDLRLAADRLMLRKAYARSVLRWRGHRIRFLEELSASL